MSSPFPDNPNWPTDYGASRLKGRFIDLLGNPIQGTLRLTPTVASVADSANELTIVAVPRTIPLDANGAFDVFIPATDDPDVNPVNWTYAVKESWDSGTGRSYAIEAPLGLTQDLVDIAPVVASVGNAIVRGASAYEIAVRNGFVGTEAQWIDSLGGGGGTGGPLLDGAVTTVKLVDGAVTGPKLGDSSITNVKVSGTAAISADKLADGTTNKLLTATERTKLTGIATGATANATDTALRDRSTHTGTQVAATISDLPENVQDIVAQLVVAGANMTVTYNDGTGQLTLTSAAATPVIKQNADGSWPARTTGTASRTSRVVWVGTLPGPVIGTQAAQAVSGLDELHVTTLVPA